MSSRALPLLAALALTVAPALAGPAAKAPVTAPVTTDSGWWWSVAPYGWLNATEGDSGMGPVVAPVNVSFSDTLDTVDMGLMGVAEFGKGRWGFGADAIYAKFSQDTALSSRLFKSARADLKETFITPRLTYTLIEKPGYKMDVLLGARYSRLELGLTTYFRTGGNLSQNGTRDFWDPILGVRGRWDITDAWYLHYMGDIGGFGVSSDLTWQAFLGVGYQFHQNWSVVLGYRGLGLDYEKDGFLVDIVSHGPILGMQASF